MDDGKIDGETVRADFNAIEAVIHYARAAHFLGLWESERVLVKRYLPDRAAPILEAGCGAGRATVGLWHLGYRQLTAFDFAEEMIDQAENLADEQGIDGIRFFVADATNLSGRSLLEDNRRQDIACKQAPATEGGFAAALFLFNGLMQIPGRERRRQAMRELRRVCRPGAYFIFTSHDRDADPVERAAWTREAEVWARGEQNPRLLEFGDRYFAHEHGQTFMHLPVRGEILEDLAATGWTHVADHLRDELARERRAVREFSDNCRFWVARR